MVVFTLWANIHPLRMIQALGSSIFASNTLRGCTLGQVLWEVGGMMQCLNLVGA